MSERNDEVLIALGSLLQFDDPPGVVEAAYADFGYPASVAPFARYMPLRDGDEPGESPMMERWHDYLTTERKAATQLT